MAEPFDFSATPITKQTKLVARWKGVGENVPYGGQWFRLTDTNGERFIPESLEEAVDVASTAYSSGGVSLILTKQSDGSRETIASTTITKIELGGGWGAWPSGKIFFDTRGMGDKGTWQNVGSITGYAQGLVAPENLTNTVAFAQFTTSTDKPGSCDFTGLIVDEAMWKLGAQTTQSGYAGFIIGNRDINNTTTANNRGYCGTIQAEFNPEVSDTLRIACFSARYTNMRSYGVGWGFMGTYAEEWLVKFPSSTATNNVRNTYLG